MRNVILCMSCLASIIAQAQQENVFTEKLCKMESVNVIEDYDYDNLGRQILKVNSVKRNGVFTPTTKVVNEYEQNTVVTILYQSEDDMWTPAVKTVSEMNDMNNPIFAINYAINPATGDWMEAYESTYQYNENGMVTEIKMTLKIMGVENLLGKEIYEYNSNNEIESSQIYAYDISGKIQLGEKYSYTYTSDTKEIVKQKYNRGNWNTTSKTIYSYDAMGNIIQTDVYAYSNDNWIYESGVRNENTYNTDCLSHTNVYQSQDGESWTYCHYEDYVYDRDTEASIVAGCPSDYYKLLKIDSDKDDMRVSYTYVPYETSKMETVNGMSSRTNTPQYDILGRSKSTIKGSGITIYKGNAFLER